eukprot:Protomagalhaensia_wolfi_Nauph_80__752@NODE_1432_length_1536_cov_4_373413_g1106_i0_p2_GENE_NODE_1432_length_1536_cov_4_373413_g1106_i0NODE_1432_length_1536_cov_4_373413_g1106_i0_p2_ORF_typecomplete_len190_score27_78OAD_gamma/PF04277_13/1_8e04OAD_gamma/PF04277_13/0_06_NODE_1432_length_1536_cov_4_373413_g1106_i0158727
MKRMFPPHQSGLPWVALSFEVVDTGVNKVVPFCEKCRCLLLFFRKTSSHTSCERLSVAVNSWSPLVELVQVLRTTWQHEAPSSSDRVRPALVPGKAVAAPVAEKVRSRGTCCGWRRGLFDKRRRNPPSAAQPLKPEESRKNSKEQDPPTTSAAVIAAALMSHDARKWSRLHVLGEILKRRIAHCQCHNR